MKHVKVAFAFGITLVLLSTAKGTADNVQEQARKATVVIQGEVQTAQGLRYSIGVGVIIGEESGLEIVTAFHVVNHEHLLVKTWDGQVLNVVRIMRAGQHDLALIETAIPSGIYPTMVTTPMRAPNSPLFVWGAPLGSQWVLSSGRIADRTVTVPADVDDQFALTCAACDEGDSGGGIFNVQGELEGILTGACKRLDGSVAFVVAMPVAQVPMLLSALRGRPPSPLTSPSTSPL